MTSRLDDASSLDLAERSLADHPTAHVSALDPLGFVAVMPPSLPRIAHQVLDPGAAGSDPVRVRAGGAALR